MQLEGIHHVTAITADAPRNVDFYARVLGLRLVKKTVNQDDPTVYHLFYADEDGSAGADLTFFEYPGVPLGRPGPGMVHRIAWRVGSEASIDFWRDRLTGEGVDVADVDGRLRFADPEGLEHELRVDSSGDEPLVALHAEVPAEHALRGFDGVRAYPQRSAEDSRALFEDALGFARTGEASWEVRGVARGGTFAFDPPPAQHGLRGAGTVHHVAFAAPLSEHAAWREAAARGGARPTPVIDRFYFRSIYFPEPGGVLFEIASIGPGYAVDEPAESLGERLSLPPAFEHLRDRVEPVLTPLPDIRAWRPARTGA